MHGLQLYSNYVIFSDILNAATNNRKSLLCQEEGFSIVNRDPEEQRK